MFNFHEKVLKKSKDEELSATEPAVAKALFDMGQANTQDKNLAQMYILSAHEVDYKQEDATRKYTLVTIPFRSLQFYKKVSGEVVSELEKKLGMPVVVVAKRTIISKRAPINSKESRPRTRTLTHVHTALLDDIVFPTRIVGKRIRVATNGARTFKVLLDPMDKDLLQDKLPAWSHVYQKLTTKKTVFDFGEPTAEMKRAKKKAPRH